VCARLLFLGRNGRDTDDQIPKNAAAGDLSFFQKKKRVAAADDLRLLSVALDIVSSNYPTKTYADEHEEQE